MKLKNNYILTFILALLLSGAGGWGAAARAEKKAETQETMTKGQAVMLLTATDFMKQRIGELLSWTVGYDVSKVNRVKLTPVINYIKAVPRRLPPDGRTVLELEASVDDPGGLANIAGVRADLSTIGRLPNTMLVDNGLYGDKAPDDGVYTLQSSVSPRVPLGARDITVAVANKKGWLALSKTTLEIRKNPLVTEVRLQPERVLAGSGTLVTITAAVDNPGRLEDVDSVWADLSPLRLPGRMQLANNGQQGDAQAGDNVWSLQFAVPSDVAPGTYLIPVQATNLIGGLGTGQGTLTVYK
ncbi:MAG: hypothetical protein JW873_03085 [Candidatus Saganbacteria bacterium]|nr:hypothetical protein [Candidatus Saganbacteria bacterium]